MSNKTAVIIVGILFVIIIVLVIVLLQPSQTENISNTQLKTPLPTATQNINSNIEIDMKKTYQALINTSEGEITVKLNSKETPITVNNFVKLSKKGFYSNTIFHRVIKGFMIQGGDPKGDGTGGPGYQFNDEPFTGNYIRGTIAMANAGPNTNGSQFFIMHKDYDLPKNYVIFGQVVKGIEVVDKIAETPVERTDKGTAEGSDISGRVVLKGEKSKPVNPIKVISVSIIEQ